MNARPLVILQARMGSSRLPGKIMMPVNGRPIIEWQLNRIRQSKLIGEIVVATTVNTVDDMLVEYLESMGFSVFRGSENDVLDRFLGVLDKYRPSTFVRLTADCPLVMPALIDEAVRYFECSSLHYLSNALDESFPDGLDVEVVKTQTLFELNDLSLTPSEREHVTLGIYQRPLQFKIGKVNSPVDLGNHRWTLDYLEDLEFISRVYNHFKGKELTFTLKEVLELLDSKPSLQNSVSPSMRNIAIKSKGANHE
jgi:spore coat polysaccharide biosynthesis protein SpsF